MPGARRIGVVGLGAMGSGMAATLVRAGFAVRGYDVSAPAVDLTPLSAVEIFVKDLGIVLDAGQRLRFPLPLAAAAHQQFLAAAAAGFGRSDDSAVVRVYERLAGIDVAAAAKAPDPPRSG